MTRAVSIIVVKRGSRVLAISRGGDPENHADLALPAGGVEEGETPFAAAARELFEETGAKATELEPIILVPSGNETEPNLYYFLATKWEIPPAGLKAEPGSIWKWVRPEELLAEACPFHSLTALLFPTLFGRSPMKTTTMDLSIGDVHVPSASDARAKRRMFADPDNSTFPIHSMEDAEDSDADLEDKRDTLPPAKYRAIKGRIRAAKRRLAAADKPARVSELAPGGAAGATGATDTPPPARKRMNVRRSKGLRVTVDHPHHGRFEIHQMQGGGDSKTFADAAVKLMDGVHRLYAVFPSEFEAQGAAEDKKLSWAQIALPGHFEGHRAGPFTMNDEVFRQIIRNYREVDGGEVFFDFEHASEADGSTVAVTGAPAQGAIKDLKIENHKLYALVDWMEPARTYIRDGKYRFVSPAIRFGAKHPRTGAAIGARLTSVALTNQPFLRGLEPLQLKDTPMTLSEQDSDEVYDTVQAMIEDALDEHAAKLQSVGASAGTNPLTIAARDEKDPLNMATETKELAVQLGESQAKVTELSTTLSSKETSLKDLSTQLSERDGAVKELSDKIVAKDALLTAKDATIAERDATIATLNAKVKEHTDEINEKLLKDAHDTYKDVKNVSLETMALILKNDRATFDKEFPVIDADKRHLRANLTDGKDAASAKSVSLKEGSAGESLPPTAELAKKLMKDAADKGQSLSNVDAQNQALVMRRQAGLKG